MPARRTAPLTRDEILAAALAIVDAEGFAALSMRRLARELGVEAMSIYHHVRDKRALLGGVVELSLRTQAPAPPRPETPWQDVVVTMVQAFRRTLVAHPNVLPLMAAHPPSPGESSAAHVEVPLRFFLANGRAGERGCPAAGGPVCARLRPCHVDHQLQGDARPRRPAGPFHRGVVCRDRASSHRRLQQESPRAKEDRPGPSKEVRCMIRLGGVPRERASGCHVAPLGRGFSLHTENPVGNQESTHGAFDWAPVDASCHFCPRVFKMAQRDSSLR